MVQIIWPFDARLLDQLGAELASVLRSVYQVEDKVALITRDTSERLRVPLSTKVQLLPVPQELCLILFLARF